MRRRDLLTGALGFTCSAVIDPSEAQTARRKRLGYLSGGGRTDHRHFEGITARPWLAWKRDNRNR